MVQLRARGLAESAKIRLDANMAWSVNEAVRNLARLDAYHIDFIEQPVKADPVTGMQEVRARTPVRVCANEGLWTVEDAYRQITARAADVFCFSPYWVGSLAQFQRLCHVAHFEGLHVVKHSHGEFGIAAAAAHHVLLTLPNVVDGNQHTAHIMQDDVLQQALPIATGPNWEVPMGSGLCVDVDEDKVTRYHEAYRERGQFLPYDQGTLAYSMMRACFHLAILNRVLGILNETLLKASFSTLDAGRGTTWQSQSINCGSSGNCFVEMAGETPASCRRRRIRRPASPPSVSRSALDPRSTSCAGRCRSGWARRSPWLRHLRQVPPEMTQQLRRVPLRQRPAQLRSTAGRCYSGWTRRGYGCVISGGRRCRRCRQSQGPRRRLRRRRSDAWIGKPVELTPTSGWVPMRAGGLRVRIPTGLALIGDRRRRPRDGGPCGGKRLWYAPAPTASTSRPSPASSGATGATAAPRRRQPRSKPTPSATPAASASASRPARR